MRVLLQLTYYRPYTSGLTIYAERLGRGLAAAGHHVIVLASRHRPDLPPVEELDGVRVIRAPVLLRLGKGVLMPTLGRLARTLAAACDVVNVHLPQLDGPRVARAAARAGKPVVITYHCDLHMPPGPLSRLAGAAVLAANERAGRRAAAVAAYTRDFADHSPFLRRHADRVAVIPPPVELPELPAAEQAVLAEGLGLHGSRPVIGMAARLASEKGAEVLAAALPLIRSRYPGARVLFAGSHQHVPGEAAYARRLRPVLAALGDGWRFLGELDPRQMSVFYPALDVLAVPSLNTTESFGLVQVEAMLAGTPSVASDLPGVRQPVLQSGMGLVAAPGDPAALADAILAILDQPDRFRRPRSEIAARWSTAATVRGYEQLFATLSGSLPTPS